MVRHHEPVMEARLPTEGQRDAVGFEKVLGCVVYQAVLVLRTLSGGVPGNNFKLARMR